MIGLNPILPPSPPIEKLSIGGIYTRKAGGQQLLVVTSYGSFYDCLGRFCYTNGEKRSMLLLISPDEVFLTPEKEIDVEFWALEIMKR